MINIALRSSIGAPSVIVLKERIDAFQIGGYAADETKIHRDLVYPEIVIATRIAHRMP